MLCRDRGIQRYTHYTPRVVLDAATQRRGKADITSLGDTHIGSVRAISLDDAKTSMITEYSAHIVMEDGCTVTRFDQVPTDAVVYRPRYEITTDSDDRLQGFGTPSARSMTSHAGYTALYCFVYRLTTFSGATFCKTPSRPTTASASTSPG